MAFFIDNSLGENCTGTGEGSLTLLSSKSLHIRFSESDQGSIGDSTYYMLISADLQWEIGIGTLDAANSLTRDTVLDSSSGDAKINLGSGTHAVYGTMPASKMIYVKGDNTIGFANNFRNTIIVADIAAMQLLDDISDDPVFVRDTTNQKGGLFVFNSSGVGAGDGKETFSSGTTSGLWERVRWQVQIPRLPDDTNLLDDVIAIVNSIPTIRVGAYSHEIFHGQGFFKATFKTGTDFKAFENPQNYWADGDLIMLLGDEAIGDTPPRVYQYDIDGDQTEDRSKIYEPTTGNGRLVWVEDSTMSVTFGDGDTTPSIAKGKVFRTANVNIENLVDAREGDAVYIVRGSQDCTIKNNSNIITGTGTDLILKETGPYAVIAMKVPGLAKWVIFGGSGGGASGAFIPDAVADFGLVSGGDKTSNKTAYENAIAFCITNNLKRLNFPAGTYEIGALTSTLENQEVIHVGEGAIEWVDDGDNIAGFLQPAPMHVSQLPDITNTLNASHLRRIEEAIQSGTANVAFVGDSNGVDPSQNGEQFNSAGLIDNLGFTVKRAVHDAYTHDRDGNSITLNFENFSIGGYGWQQLNDPGTIIAVGARPWAADPAVSWWTNVTNFTPNLLIIALGGNDDLSNLADIDAMVTKIKAMTPVPDVVLVTEPFVSTSYAYQDGSGRDAAYRTAIKVRNYIRMTAIENGWGLIDVHRWQEIVQHGRDPLEIFFRLHSDSVDMDDLIGSVDLSSATAGLTNYPTKFHGSVDYQFDVDMNTATGSPWIECRLGDTDDKLLLKNNEAQLWRDANSSASLVKTETFSAITSTRRIRVIRRNDYVFVGHRAPSASEAEYETLLEEFHYKGLETAAFEPKIGAAPIGTPSGSTLLLFNIQMYYPVFQRFCPRVTNEDVWGTETLNPIGGSFDFSLYSKPDGGDGGAHPSGRGVREVYGVIKNYNWRPVIATIPDVTIAAPFGTCGLWLTDGTIFPAAPSTYNPGAVLPLDHEVYNVGSAFTLASNELTATVDGYFDLGLYVLHYKNSTNSAIAPKIDSGSGFQTLGEHYGFNDFLGSLSAQINLGALPYLPKAMGIPIYLETGDKVRVESVGGGPADVIEWALSLSLRASV